jgi:hypothetical protein
LISPTGILRLVNLAAEQVRTAEKVFTVSGEYNTHLPGNVGRLVRHLQLERNVPEVRESWQRRFPGVVHRAMVKPMLTGRTPPNIAHQHVLDGDRVFSRSSSRLPDLPRAVQKDGPAAIRVRLAGDLLPPNSTVTASLIGPPRCGPASAAAAPCGLRSRREPDICSRAAQANRATTIRIGTGQSLWICCDR